METVKRIFLDDYNISFLWLMLSIAGGAIATYW